MWSIRGRGRFEELWFRGRVVVKGIGSVVRGGVRDTKGLQNFNTLASCGSVKALMLCGVVLAVPLVALISQ